MLRVVLIVSVALLSLYRALIGCERRAPPLLSRDRALYAWKKTRVRAGKYNMLKMPSNQTINTLCFKVYLWPPMVLKLYGKHLHGKYICEIENIYLKRVLGVGKNNTNTQFRKWPMEHLFQILKIMPNLCLNIQMCML
jgi:hypothetical protein